MDFICSIDRDVFRKPCTGMYNHVVEHPLSLSTCINALRYVGLLGPSEVGRRGPVEVPVRR